MIRTTLMLIAAAWTLTLAGCGGGDREASESDAKVLPAVGEPGANDAGNEAPIDTSGAKSEIVRTLLAALEEVKGESQDAKNDLREILLDADDELAASLGDNSRRLIMQHANKKPVPLLIGGPVPAPAGQPSSRPAKPLPGLTPISVSSTSDDAPGEPQTPIVRSLLAALNEAEVEDEDKGVKAQLRRSLIEADVQLRQVLGDNSKRMIVERANRKPVALRIPEGLPVVESP